MYTKYQAENTISDIIYSFCKNSESCFSGCFILLMEQENRAQYGDILQKKKKSINQIILFSAVFYMIAEN